MNELKKGKDYTGITVVFLCFDEQGRLLMNKRSEQARDEKGRWDCGGGGLEFGQMVVDALKEEIQQEYCAQIISSEFLGFRDVHRESESGPSHWIALDFKVLVDPSTVANGEPHKFDEIGWFDINHLPKPLHSQLQRTIDSYQGRL